MISEMIPTIFFTNITRTLGSAFVALTLLTTTLSQSAEGFAGFEARQTHPVTLVGKLLLAV